jgi:hypothetical protein
VNEAVTRIVVSVRRHVACGVGRFEIRQAVETLGNEGVAEMHPVRHGHLNTVEVVVEDQLVPHAVPHASDARLDRNPGHVELDVRLIDVKKEIGVLEVKQTARPRGPDPVGGSVLVVDAPPSLGEIEAGDRAQVLGCGEVELQAKLLNGVGVVVVDLAEREVVLGLGPRVVAARVGQLRFFTRAGRHGERRDQCDGRGPRDQTLRHRLPSLAEHPERGRYAPATAESDVSSVRVMSIPLT